MCSSTEKTSSDRLSPHTVGTSPLRPQSVSTRVITPHIKSDDDSTTDSCDSDTCESSRAENDISQSWWKNPIAKSSKM